jgi:hypothetical protein
MTEKVSENQKTRQAVVASMTIRDGACMTSSGRRAIAKWLRQEASFFLANAKDYAPRFRATYYYPVPTVSQPKRRGAKAMAKPAKPYPPMKPPMKPSKGKKGC